MRVQIYLNFISKLLKMFNCLNLSNIFRLMRITVGAMEIGHLQVDRVIRLVVEELALEKLTTGIT